MSTLPPLWYPGITPSLTDWLAFYQAGITQPVSNTSILNFGGGVGGDDALAMRNAIASGSRLIYVPPGDYYCKSALPTWGHASNPSCFEINGREGVWISAYGARFFVDPSISGPGVATTTFSITNNSKNCGLLGGTFVGNNTGLAQGAENVAINLASVTDCVVRDPKITGHFLTSISGVYIFDSLIDNVRCYTNAQPMDIGHIENLTVRNCRFVADATFPVTGINQHYDVPTLGDNTVTNEDGTPRSLRDGQSNRLHVLDNVFVGFQNSIALDDMIDGVISRNTIQGVPSSGGLGTAGALLYLSTPAQAANKVHRSTIIEDTTITGCGNIGSSGQGGGVLLGTGVTHIALRNNRIFDNFGYGVTAVGTAGLSDLSALGNDFRSPSGSSVQIAPYHPSLIPLMVANLGDNAPGWALSARADVVLFQQPFDTRAITAGPAGYLGNNSNLSWQGSDGQPHPVIGLSPTNIAFVRAGSDAAYVALQGGDGVDALRAGETGVQVPGSFSAGSIMTNNAEFFTDVTVHGTTTLGGFLNVVGLMTTNALNAGGPVTAGNSLNVVGTTTLGGPVFTPGAVTVASTFNVVHNGDNGQCIIGLFGDGPIVPNKYLRVTQGRLQIANSAFTANILELSDSGVLTVASSIQCGHDLGVAGGAAIQGPFAASGAGTFGTTLNVAGNLTAGASFSVVGNTVHNGTTALNGKTTLGTGATFNAPMGSMVAAANDAAAATAGVSLGDFYICTGTSPKSIVLRTV